MPAEPHPTPAFDAATAYNHEVIRAVALWLVVVYAAAGAADLIWCPDGCQAEVTTRATGPQQPPATGTCLFCGTGYVVPTFARPVFSMTRLPDRPTGAVPSLQHAERNPLDHPPRVI